VQARGHSAEAKLTEHLARWDDSRIEARAVNGHEVELTVPADAKLAVLRRLTDTPGIEDIELLPPTLEHLYTHFSAGLSPAQRGDAR